MEVSEIGLISLVKSLTRNFFVIGQTFNFHTFRTYDSFIEAPKIDAYGGVIYEEKSRSIQGCILSSPSALFGFTLKGRYSTCVINMIIRFGISKDSVRRGIGVERSLDTK